MSTVVQVLVAIPLGALIGLTLGALGGGGSILTVPALVYALGETPREATTASLVIVGISAIAGAVAHGRAGRVRWKAGVGFGLVGIAGSAAGSHLNRAVNPNVLLLAFATLMVFVALRTLLDRRAGMRSPTAPEPDHPAGDARGGITTSGLAGPGLAAPAPDGVLVADPPVATAADSPPARVRPGDRALKIAAAGTVVGALTGFFGVGGGFVIVPALTVTLGYTMPEAVGTSLVVIAVNAAQSLALRVGTGTGTMHWAVLVPFTAAAIAGSLAGNHLTGLIPAHRLTRAFGVLLLAVAAYVATRGALAIA